MEQDSPNRRQDDEDNAQIPNYVRAADKTQLCPYVLKGDGKCYHHLVHGGPCNCAHHAKDVRATKKGQISSKPLVTFDKLMITINSQDAQLKTQKKQIEGYQNQISWLTDQF